EKEMLEEKLRSLQEEHDHVCESKSSKEKEVEELRSRLCESQMKLLESEEALSKISEENAYLSDKLDNEVKSAASSTARVESLNAEVLQKEYEIIAFQNSISSAEAKIAALESSFASLCDEKLKLENEFQLKASQYVELECRIRNLEAWNSSTKSSLDSKVAELAAMEELLKEANTKLDGACANASALESEHSEMQRRNVELSNALATKVVELSRAEEHREAVLSDLSDVKKQLADCSQELVSSRELFQAEIHQLNDDIKVKEQSIAETTASLAAARQEIEKSVSEVSTLQSRLDNTKMKVGFLETELAAFKAFDANSECAQQDCPNLPKLRDSKATISGLEVRLRQLGKMYRSLRPANAAAAAAQPTAAASTATPELATVAAAAAAVPAATLRSRQPTQSASNAASSVGGVNSPRSSRRRTSAAPEEERPPNCKTS
ncbi:hypothetical protein BOX15_Mlig032420g1, partial [Macrostomum lignano]